MSDIFPSADGAASAPMPVLSMTLLLKRFFLFYLLWTGKVDKRSHFVFKDVGFKCSTCTGGLSQLPRAR